MKKNDTTYRKQIPFDWNYTENNLINKTIHELFEIQVRKTPNNTAVIFNNTKLTYVELNASANQLAHYLLANYQLKPEDLVVLYLDRSEQMIIAILAVLKAGCAYVPIDQNYPSERVNYILNDTNAKVILTNDVHGSRLKLIVDKHNTNKKTAILNIDDKAVTLNIKSYTSSNLKIKVKSRNLCYVIYTSGTTGNPKGVMIEHAGVVNKIQWMNAMYPLNEKDNILQKTPYIFDVSVWELLWGLLYGSCLTFALPEEHRNPNYIIDIINDKAITIIHFIPSMLTVFEDELELRIANNLLNKINPLPTLKYVFCSGEQLLLYQVKKVHKLLHFAQIINLYGPTETTIEVLYYNCTSRNIKKIYIGKPIYNIKAYVLDHNLTPVPLGNPGELYIAGIGLARGYLNNQKLTAEKFIDNPFQSKLDKQSGQYNKLYKTGDIVKWNRNGNIEYIGRNDFQVKIRGYRIELAEIENVLNRFPEIKQAVVLVKNNSDNKINSGSDKFLMGYYLSNNKLDEVAIYDYLKTYLPDYMIPNTIVYINKLPLTISGKVDRGALSKLELNDAIDYTPPRNKTETQMRSIWTKVLKYPETKIGINNDFFKLGGNSILAVKLVQMINQKLKLNLTVLDLLKEKTILRLVNNRSIFNPPTNKNIKNILNCEISSFEKSILTHHMIVSNKKIYNESFLFEIKQNISYEIFQNSISSLINKYEILNTNYIFKNDDILKFINKNSSLICKEITINQKNTKDILYKLIATEFNLSVDKLIRFYMYKKDNISKILIIFHHSILDATSIINVLLPELYALLVNNTKELLKPQTVATFIDLNKKLINYYSSNLESYKTYWIDFLNRFESVNINDRKLLNEDHSGKQIAFTLDTNVLHSIRKISEVHGISSFAIYLSVFYILLNKITNKKSIAIRSNIDERFLFPEHRDTIGCFINNIFIGIDIDSFESLLELIQMVQISAYESMDRLIKYDELLKLNKNKVIELSEIHFNLEPNEIIHNNYIQSQIHGHSQEVKNGLYFEIEEKSDRILGRVEYKTGLYSNELVKLLIKGYTWMLNNINDNIHRLVQHIDIIDDKFISTVLNKTIYYKEVFKSKSEHFNDINDSYLVNKIGLVNLQKSILSIWQAILNRRNITLDDNFFDLGGHSLKILTLKNQLQTYLKITNVNPTDLFQYPTIRSYSNYLYHNNITKHYNLQTQEICEQEIAIIGMSGAFSGSDSIQQYWNNLIEGKECLDILSKEQCIENGVDINFCSDPNYVGVNGRLKNIDKFDYNFFGLSPKNAQLLDPQSRVFLEHSWALLESGGYIATRQEENIGVFCGAGKSDYMNKYANTDLNFSSENDSWQTNIMESNNYLATHISYMLGLEGTAININTACSTSLVAVVEACEKLLLGRCNMAIAGGVYFPLPHQHGYIFKEGMIFSKDGHCRVFDDKANGTVGGAGVGVVLLKRLADARRDGDKIIAVIKGYMTNNDGQRKVGFTAPSVAGQSECIIQAQRQAKLSSNSISYIECHGTGTILGDPIEVNALDQAFKMNSDDNYSNSECILGSVKANIGHADVAAGIAGLIKVCKMIETGMIPPQINFESLNRSIDFNRMPFKIVNKKQKWKNSKANPKRAGVSSFGIGGTNAHVILEEFITDDKQIVTSAKNNYILPISAKTENSLTNYKKVLIEYLSNNSKAPLQNIAYTLQQKRVHFEYRQCIICNSHQDAVTQLKNLETYSHISTSIKNYAADLIFMFSAQGSQYCGMGIKLYNTEHIFQNIIDECCSIISDIKKIDFKSLLLTDITSPEYVKYNVQINQTELAQPAIFCISYALAKLYESWGITANVFIGHSIGEYVAATLSGVFNLEDALKCVVKRGVLMQQMQPGAMVGINLPYNMVRKHLFGSLEISAINSPQYCVVSGHNKDIEKFELKLNKLDIKHSRLHTSHAFHSKAMAEAAMQFEKFLDNIPLSPPKVPFISSSSGKVITAEEATYPQYWAKQIISPVLFSEGVNALLQQYDNPIFLEIGAGDTLSTLVQQHKNYTDKKIISISSMYSAGLYKIYREDKKIFDALGKLWLNGYKISWSKLNFIPTAQLDTELPTYQFERNQCWIEGNEDNRNKFKKSQETEVTQPKPTHVDSIFTETEEKIALIFYKILGIKNISKYDNFFDLGGTSLNAIELINKLSDLNIKVSMSNILKFNSIYSLSIYKNNSQSMIIIPLKINQDAKENVFFIHPINGTIFSYLKMAQQLSSKYNYYGIQNIDADGKQLVKAKSLEELAEKYIKEVIHIQPYGNYNFVGWSLGGIIGYEMSRQLLKLKRKTNFVAMLDSWTIFFEHGYTQNQYRNYLLANINSYLNMEKKNRSNYDDTIKETFFETSWQLLQLLLNYSFKKNSVKIHLFKAMILDEKHTTLNMPDNGWGKYVSSKVNIYPMQASHDSIILNPTRDKIIVTLNKIFNSI